MGPLPACSRLAPGPARIKWRPMAIRSQLLAQSVALVCVRAVFSEAIEEARGVHGRLGRLRDEGSGLRVRHLIGVAVASRVLHSSLRFRAGSRVPQWPGLTGARAAR